MRCEHQHEHGDDVHQIDDHLEEQPEPHPLQAEEIAEHHIIRKSQRRRPDAGVTVHTGVRAHRGAASEEREGPLDQGFLQEQHRCADHPGHRQRAQQGAAQTLCFACTMGLGDEPGRPHAQEAEAPEQEIEQQAAEGHAAQIGRVGEVARDPGVDRRDDGLGEVGEDDRDSEPDHPPVSHARPFNNHLFPVRGDARRGRNPARGRGAGRYRSHRPR